MTVPRPPSLLRDFPLLLAALLAGAAAAALTAGYDWAAALLGVTLVASLLWLTLDYRRQHGGDAAAIAAWRERAIGLEKLVTEDELTGLGNERQFAMDFWRSLARYQRRGETFAVAILDMADAFRVERSLTPAVLRKCAEIVGVVTRTEDSVCRMDRQTFVVLLAATNEAGAERFVERVRIDISGHVFNEDGPTVYVTVYGGVAEWSPEMKSMIELLRTAEKDLQRFGMEYGREAAFFKADSA